MDFSPDGRVLAAAAGANMININSAHDGRFLHVLEGLTHHPAIIAFSPDGRLLASGSHDARILLWEIP